jgi:hypothetical protein
MLTEIVPVTFDAEQFVKSLYSAYLEVVAKHEKPVGAIIPIEEIIQSLAVSSQTRAWRLDPHTRNYRSYGRDRFRANLFRLLEQHPQPTHEQYLLNLAAGSNTQNALFMYIPSLGRCAYVGLLSWRKKTDNEPL